MNFACFLQDIFLRPGQEESSSLGSYFTDRKKHFEGLHGTIGDLLEGPVKYAFKNEEKTDLTVSFLVLIDL